MASIVSSDLVAYHAATQSDVDGSTVGGAIDTLRRPDFTQIAANDTIQAISSAAGDTTQTVTMTARNAAGSVVTETKTLTGTTAITFSTLSTVERVLKAELSGSATGTVTIRRTTGPTTIRTIPPGERGFSAIFRQLSSDAVTPLSFYAKFFWKNTNGTNSLLSAQVSESADPTGLIDHGLAATVGDSGTTTNRQTAPAGVTFASTAANVPGTDLASGAAIGVWLRLALTAGNTAIRNTYTSQLAGSTT